MSKTLLFRLALVMVTAIAFYGLQQRTRVTAENEARPARGFIVSRVAGVLASRGAGQAGWRELKSGDQTADAQSVRLSANAFVELLGRNGTLHLRHGARAEIKRTDPDILVELTAGQLHADASTLLTVVTPAGNVIIKGEALVTCAPNGTQVSVARGKARVQRSGSAATEEIGSRKAADVTTEALRPGVFDEAAFGNFALPKTNGDDETPASVSSGRGMGRLVLKDTNGNETLPLENREMRIHTQIFGPLAITEIEQTFFNPTHARAEGTFYFPLPAGASISRVAMYIDGQLMEGEVVERLQARRVYEEIVRKMRDPLLMEWQEGNIFKTRIFPIEARSPKRILISYTELLPQVDGERCYVYPLVSKLTQTGKIGRFEITAEVNGVPAAAVRPFTAYSDAVVEPNDKLTRVSLQRKDFRPNRDFVLRFMEQAREPMQLLTDRRTGEDGFFLMSYTAAAPQPPAKSLPRDVVVLFDTSLSRRADDYRAQLTAARTLLQELNAEDRFAVIGFDVTARPQNKTFEQGSAAVDEVLQSLTRTMPLGGTNLELALKAAGEFLTANPPNGIPEIVCISDGIATLGETQADRVIAKALPVLSKHNARFHAMAMGSTQDRLVLSELARQSGGLFRTIMPGSEVEHDVFRFALALSTELKPAPELKFSGGDVYDVYPKIGRTLAPGEEMFFVGRYQHAGALDVTATVPQAPTVTAKFQLPETNSANVLMPRMWARERLDALLLERQTNETIQRVVDLSQEYTLISPYTSFLVLENEQAYENYRIDRRKRRRYWEEIGKLRSAPPKEEIRVFPVIRPAPEEKKPDCVPSFELVYGMGNAPRGRVIATALSALSLQVYYRYAQITPDSDTHSAFGASDIVVPPDILARAELSDYFETINPDRPDTQSAFGNPNAQMFHSNSGNDAAGGGGADFTVLEDLIGVGGASSDFIGIGAQRWPGTGGGWGGGDGTGGGADRLAGSFGNRTGGGRRLMVKRHGGSRATESATDAALRWLASVQRDDGTWGNVEETSLAMLAFAGAGHTEKVGEWKNHVRRGVTALMGLQKDDGRIGGNTYEHAVATIAMAETAGMANVPITRASAQKAVDHLAALQLRIGNRRSGWGQDKTPEPVLTVFAVMGLKCGKVAGLKVDHEVFDGAIEALDAFEAAEPIARMSPLKLGGLALARQFLGWKKEDPEILKKAERLAQLPDHHLQSEDLAFIRYFGTLVMFQQGGDMWQKWNTWNKSTLVGAQCRATDLRGSWDPRGIELPWRAAPDETLATDIGMAVVEKALPSVKLNHPQTADYDAFGFALRATRDFAALQALLEKIPEGASAFKALVHARKGYLYGLEKKYDDSAREFLAAYQHYNQSEELLQGHVEALLKAKRAGDALSFLMQAHREVAGPIWIDNKIIEVLLRDDNGVTEPADYLAEQLKRGVPEDLALKVRYGRAAIIQQPANAAQVLKQAYEETDGKADDIFESYITALRQDLRAPEALAKLLGEVRNAPELNGLRLKLISELLFDPAAKIADPTAVIYAELKDNKTYAAALLLLVAERQAAKKNWDEAFRNYRSAYVLSGKTEACSRKYVNALLLQRDADTLLPLLVAELRANARPMPWRVPALLTAIQIKGLDVEQFTADSFPDHPEARGMIQLLMARTALHDGNKELANRLFRNAYDLAGRPEEAFLPYVDALLGGSEFKKAAAALERAIQGGYHTPWAFRTLANVYQAQQLPLETRLRAICSQVELFPKEAQPRIDLAQRFEQMGQYESALEQYMEAVRIRPEDGYFYKLVIERAIGRGRFDFVREAIETLKRSGAMPNIQDPELLEIVRRLGDKDVAAQQQYEQELRKAITKDLVVIASWDTGETDIDLHVTEPSGEVCCYRTRRTKSGGTLDHDVVRGFGPETYALREARPGKYVISVNYFNGAPRTNVTLQIFRKRNGEQETMETHTVALEKIQVMTEVLTVEIK